MEFVRKPAVAGQFYPSRPAELEKMVADYLKSDKKPRKAIAVVSPHAGYIYSGPVAGAVFAQTIIPKRAVILSPNHTGYGARVAIISKGSWQVPTGIIPIDEELACEIKKGSEYFEEDVVAHRFEHSLEVQLPFLLARQPSLSFVPITVSNAAMDMISKLGEAIADAIKKSSQDVLIVASSDMNHYEDEKMTRQKDELALAKVLALDAEGLLHTCAREGITMCGVVPTAIAIEAAKNLGAKTATLVKHATSGDVSKDYDSVVGYAGVMIE